MEPMPTGTPSNSSAMEPMPTDNPPPYTPPIPNPPTAPSLIKPQKFFGPHSMQITCSNCHQQINTSVVHDYGSCTMIAVVTVFIFCFPFFWLPLVIDVCKDVHHTCPACNALQGTYKII